MPARGQDRWYQPACPSPSDPWQQQREELRATRGMQEPRTRQANLREKERQQPWVRGSKCLQTHQGGNWPLRAPDTRVSEERHTNRNSSKGP